MGQVRYQDGQGGEETPVDYGRGSLGRPEWWDVSPVWTEREETWSESNRSVRCGVVGVVERVYVCVFEIRVKTLDN